MQEALRRRLIVEPSADIDVTFDDASLPWHTASTVSGLDRPGQLSAVATAFALAGVTVHGARVATDGDRFSGRFAVTDRHGRKLDDGAKARVRQALAGGHARRGLFAGRR